MPCREKEEEVDPGRLEEEEEGTRCPCVPEGAEEDLPLLRTVSWLAVLPHGSRSLCEREITTSLNKTIEKCSPVTLHGINKASDNVIKQCKVVRGYCVTDNPCVMKFRLFLSRTV